MIGFLIFSSFYILLKENQSNEKQFDNSRKAILVILGAAVWSDNKPSPILAARVEKSVSLLSIRNFNIEKIYFTGGSAPGENSEAEVAYDYFSSLNSDFKNVELETSTSSTNEQIQFIKNKILPLYADYEIFVISDSFHLVRIKEISNFHHIKIKTVASDFAMSISSNIYNRIRESLALTLFWLFSI
jgi:vancomycin permeability regulator SanA